MHDTRNCKQYFILGLPIIFLEHDNIFKNVWVYISYLLTLHFFIDMVIEYDDNIFIP